MNLLAQCNQPSWRLLENIDTVKRVIRRPVIPNIVRNNAVDSGLRDGAPGRI